MSRFGGLFRLGFWPYLGIIVLLFVGGEGVYTALDNPEPLVTTVSDYLRTNSKALWIKFKNAKLDLGESAYVEKYGRVNEIFIALRDIDAPPGSKAHILLAIKDRDLISDLMEAEKKSERALPSMVLKNEFSGLIRFSTSEDSTMRGRIGTLSMNLAPDYKVLNEGGSPDVWTSMGYLIAAMGLFCLIWRNRKVVSSVPPPLPPPLAPPKV